VDYISPAERGAGVGELEYLERAAGRRAVTAGTLRGRAVVMWAARILRDAMDVQATGGDGTLKIGCHEGTSGGRGG
jgi:hypothetical protein